MYSLNHKYFRAALKQARGSVDPNFRVGAVLVRSKNIIALGSNGGYKTHPLQAEMYPERHWKGPHAEVMAVKHLRPYDVGGGDLFVYRILKDGKPALAKPCSKCLKFLYSKGVKRVFYTLDSGKTARLKISP